MTAPKLCEKLEKHRISVASRSSSNHLLPDLGYFLLLIENNEEKPKEADFANSLFQDSSCYAPSDLAE